VANVSETVGGGAPRPSRTEYLKHFAVGSRLETPVATARRLRARYLCFRVPELGGIWSEPADIDQAIRRIVRPGDNVVDVGAHLGSFTSLVMRLSPTGRHVAVEALPYKAEWLRRKFPQVEVHDVAVSDGDGTVTFHHNVGRSGYSGIDAHAEDGDRLTTFTVRTARLDDLVPADRPIRFLKIDVEGAELRALAGATRLLDDWRPLVLFECTSTTTDETTRRDLYDFFVKRDYDVHMVCDWLTGRGPIGHDTFEGAMKYPFRAFNFLAAPRD
jgi:FkbM family methyltransferase